MGRKGSWFSAIKRVFTPHTKEKSTNDYDKRKKKEKNKNNDKVRNGESNSFIPLFREPSSVEKIFLDFEREQQRIPPFKPSSTHQHHPSTTPPFLTPRLVSPRTSSARHVSPIITTSPPRASSPTPIIASSPTRRIAGSSSPRYGSHSKSSFRLRPRPEPTIRHHHASATKIQAAYRGYVARRSLRALKGLVRLQGVVRGQNVKRQTMNAMKQMQLLVRVQTQIQSRRIQMLDNQTPHHQAHYKHQTQEHESAFGKWSFTHPYEAGNQEDWDDSLLTREEIEGRLQRKAEAIIKRERAMAYAYSHQLWKASPNSAQAIVADIRSAGFPWWWNWLERQLPPSNNPPSSEPQTLKNFLLAPPTPQTNQNQTQKLHQSNNNISKQQHHQIGLDNTDTPTPKSTKSSILPSTKPPRNSPAFQIQTPPAFRTPPANTSKYYSRYSKSTSPFDVALKDDDSLTSCPPFSVPHYMAPTVSAKAKLRGGVSPRDRFVMSTTSSTTPTNESKKRVSLPFTQGLGSFKWNKGSLFSNKDSNSQRILDKNQSLQSIENLSVDSTVSLPAGVGRKPFNRFV